MFTVERKLITPSIARAMLERNTGNRKPRPATFLAYEKDMKAGKWIETHEAIALSKSGNIINGQHRLMALARAEVSLWFLVVTYDDVETAIDLPIDCGAKRSLADITGEPAAITQTASMLWRYAICGRQIEPRPHEMAEILRTCKPAIDSAIDVSRSNRKFRTSAMTRSAIVASLLVNEEKWKAEILESYRRWVVGENAIWPSVEALNKQFEKIKSQFNTETWCKVWMAFQPDRQSLKIIRVGKDSQTELLRSVRQSLRDKYPTLAAFVGSYLE